jgi:FkbM family methyltransferase
MNWKLIIIFIILVLFTIIIFVICNYGSSNKNISTTFEKIKNLLMFPNKKIKNPIDGSDMLWEESDFTRKNWPGLDYDIEEKKAIFNFAKNNNPDYGVIDVGAHIGDLSISLALALKNIGRDDVTVYAIDPSQEKCDFMKKMSIINSVSNIKILNYGLSDLKKILGHSENTNNDDNNTGKQRWDIKKEKINLTKTNEEESNIFIPADDLFKKGEIGLIGVYHIDVEGHEIDVLKGSKNLINTCKPILLIENFIIGTQTQLKCRNKNECVTLFKTIEDINSSYKHTGFLPNGDLIFVPSE